MNNYLKYVNKYIYIYLILYKPTINHEGNILSSILNGAVSTVLQTIIK